MLKAVRSIAFNITFQVVLMKYEELKQSIQQYSGRQLDQRKRWYSPAAKAYNEARPHYPSDLVRQVVDIAHLSAGSTILEVGCGPATATVAFAPFGCSMHCLEPNLDFYVLAQHNCRQYPNVVLQNTSFEEWELEPNTFDAVLAASSFHWIPSDVGYPKAAQALKESGYLILLWNKELQPSYEVHQRLADIYEVHAPSLNRFETKETQETILNGLGQIVLDSGHFKNLVANYIESSVIYSTDQYLTLLNTYSPYLSLDPESKKALFSGLKHRIDQDFDGNLQLSYISAFHIAQKW